MTSYFDLDTPALLVDADRLAHNISTMAAAIEAGGKRLRPHIKTHKTPEIARMQVDAGAIGITVAKLGEAEVMAEAGFKDIFIANQIVGPQKIARLVALCDRARIIVAVDSWDVAEPLSRAAATEGGRIPVRIEFDTGLGRAGTRSLPELLQLAQLVVCSEGLEFVGIFTHEGHLYKSGSPDARKRDAVDVGERLRAATAALAAQGTPALDVSAGSTPGAALLADEEGITELRPGVYVFNDRMQVRIGADPLDCAVSVLATVTSVRPDGRIIIDAGTKSLSSDKAFTDPMCGEVVGRPDLHFIGVSEEHGHLQAQGEPGLKVGDMVRVIPNHACTCVNLHETLTLIRGEQVEAVWRIAARGQIR